MTDDLLQLARDSGATVIFRSASPELLNFDYDELSVFAQRIRADERERCAVICDNERVDVAPPPGDVSDIAYNVAIDHCIATLRTVDGDGVGGGGNADQA